MPIKADLDEIDWKILRELQNNGWLSALEFLRHHACAVLESSKKAALSAVIGRF